MLDVVRSVLGRIAIALTHRNFRLLWIGALASIAADSIDHLRRCIEMLFGVGTKQAKQLTEGDSK